MRSKGESELSSDSSSNSWIRSTVKENIFTTLPINAHSIKNKMASFKKILNELVAHVCLLTETLLSNENKINDDLEDFYNRSGYNFLRKDRQFGRRGGGIAIYYDKPRIQMSKSKIPPSKHEVLAAVGRRVGQRRKIVFIVSYVPPWYNAQQDRSLYVYLNDVILAIKNKYENPMIVLGGDFNRRHVKEATRDYPDMLIVKNWPD